MKAVKLQLATRTLLNPAAPQWNKVPAEEIALRGVPLHLQPSRYIRTAWAGRPIGGVRTLRVQAAHNSRDIAFRLEWQDTTENRDYGDGSVFPDAAAVLFPLSEQAPLASTGTGDSPVALWYWRATAAAGEAEELIGRGPGVFERAAEGLAQSRARWEDGSWSVVLAGPLDAKTAGAQLFRDGTAQAAFAVWEGSGQERAGLHSLSRLWQELDIE